MLEAIVAGRDDAEALAGLARGRLRSKHDRLVAALRGLLGEHQRRMLGAQLRHIDFLDAGIATLSADVAERMRPFGLAVALVDSIPGIALRTAEAILAETGVDMSRFPSAAHLASWARVCPGTDESAGKRRPGSTGKGNAWLRTALVEAAHAAARTKGTYLAAQYKRIAARRGAGRAAVAVAHSILVIVYHLLRDGVLYQDLGASWFDERDRSATVRRTVKRLEALGYRVTIEPAA
jgi:transposase